jgi:hypothetical protein
MLQEDFYREVRAFLVTEAESRGRVVAPEAIGEHDNLFDLRVVNSFSMARLLVHVEALAGTKIDVTAFEPQTFFTLAGMYEALHAADRQPQ